ncbi:hypothetical protein MASR2M117_00050 [Paludibacter sp.]
MKKISVYILTLLLISSSYVEGKNIFVSVEKGNNKNDGLSTEMAVKTISQGIKLAEAGDKVLIEAGVYELSRPVKLKEDVSLYGSYEFANGQWTRSLKENGRPYEFKSPTVVSGELYDGTADNSTMKNTRLFEAVTTTPSSAEIDGITFTKGQGKSTVGNENGGALYSKTPGITLRNCIFSQNGVTKEDASWGGMGGAIFCSEITVIENCLFVENFADKGTSGGGAIYIKPKSEGSVIKNCVFESNSSNNSGAALRLNGVEKIVVEDCLFFNNVAKDEKGFRQGGAIYIAGEFNPTRPSTSAIVNCTIYNNSGTSVIFASGGSIKNTTIANNIGGLQITANEVAVMNTVMWGNKNAANDNAIGIVTSAQYLETLTLENFASDKKMGGLPTMVLKSVNDDSKGPNFIAPTNFAGAKEGEKYLQINFHTKESSPLNKKNIGVKSK